MSKLEQISTLIAVVEEGGFAAAARKRGVSTAAVSRQITQLENELSVQLLNRTTRYVELTDLGHEYYQRCRKVVSDLQEAESVIASAKDEVTGDLHIVAARFFAVKYLLPRLSDFQFKYPNLNIHLQLAERFPNFEKEDIDVVLGVTIDGPPELVRKKIAVTRYVLCASPDYLRQYGVPKVPSDLVRHLYITHSMRHPQDAVLFKNEVVAHVNPTMWLNDSYAMRECAIEGMGLVNLHDYVVADAIKAGRLVEVMAEYQHAQQNVYLYYQQKRYLQSKIRCFIDFFQS